MTDTITHEALAAMARAVTESHNFGAAYASYIGELDVCYRSGVLIHRNAPEVAAIRAEERQRAALHAACHSDARPRRDSMDWNEGYMDGCRGAAAAIRALTDKETGHE